MKYLLKANAAFFAITGRCLFHIWKEVSACGAEGPFLIERCEQCKHDRAYRGRRGSGSVPTLTPWPLRLPPPKDESDR